jgi:hypothetical protein
VYISVHPFCKYNYDLKHWQGNFFKNKATPALMAVVMANYE